MEIKIGEYKTRSGNKAVVLATGAPGPYPIVGYVVGDDSEYSEPTAWDPEGHYYHTKSSSPQDLVEVWHEPKTVTGTAYVWLFRDGCVGVYGNNNGAGWSRDYAGLVANKRLHYTITEGEFDDEAPTPPGGPL